MAIIKQKDNPYKVTIVYNRIKAINLDFDGRVGEVVVCTYSTKADRDAGAAFLIAQSYFFTGSDFDAFIQGNDLNRIKAYNFLKTNDDFIGGTDDDPNSPTITVAFQNGNITPARAPNVTISGITTNVEDGRVVTIVITDEATQTKPANTTTVTATVASNAYSVSGINLTTFNNGKVRATASVSNAAGVSTPKAKDNANLTGGQS